MSREIVVYSSPLCVPCEKLKRYLSASGVEFTVRDVMMDEAAGELLDSRNIRSTPALGIDGEIYAGADLQPARIDALLGI
jgi:glutaredoxin